MGISRVIILSGCLLISVLGANAQLLRPVEQLAEHAKNSVPTGYSPHLNRLLLTPKGNFHYLFPLYHAFKDEEKFKKIYSPKGYYEELSQYFAFAGDYQTALQYLEMSYDSVPDFVRRKVFKTVEGVKEVEHVDARRYIRFVARAHPVIMINQSYSKPLHSAFVLSLLGDLYRQGFRYLAMEMLNNFSNRSLSQLNLQSGYYTGEPVAGELVREALSLGYTLVPYEDTAARQHTATQRDSVQAGNIYSILQRDTAAKVLVYASYGHISKKAGEDGYIPMALAFRNISGIDPLTIDQTDMTEEGNFGYGRVLYQAYLQKFPLKTASIAMVGNDPINVTNSDLYDLTVIHPPTTFLDGRPGWLTLDGLRKPVSVKPVSPNVYFVQAYYLNEVEKNENKPWQLVPADQTYIQGGKKNYTLYLRTGKYAIFFRDINYQQLGRLNIDVE